MRRHLDVQFQTARNLSLASLLFRIQDAQPGFSIQLFIAGMSLDLLNQLANAQGLLLLLLLLLLLEFGHRSRAWKQPHPI